MGYIKAHPVPERAIEDHYAMPWLPCSHDLGGMRRAENSKTYERARNHRRVVCKLRIVVCRLQTIVRGQCRASWMVPHSFLVVITNMIVSLTVDVAVWIMSSNVCRSNRINCVNQQMPLRRLY